MKKVLVFAGFLAIGSLLCSCVGPSVSTRPSGGEGALSISSDVAGALVVERESMNYAQHYLLDGFDRSSMLPARDPRVSRRSIASSIPELIGSRELSVGTAFEGLVRRSFQRLPVEIAVTIDAGPLSSSKWISGGYGLGDVLDPSEVKRLAASNHCQLVLAIEQIDVDETLIDDRQQNGAVNVPAYARGKLVFEVEVSCWIRIYNGITGEPMEESVARGHDRDEMESFTAAFDLPTGKGHLKDSGSQRLDSVCLGAVDLALANGFSELAIAHRPLRGDVFADARSAYAAEWDTASSLVATGDWDAASAIWKRRVDTEEAGMLRAKVLYNLALAAKQASRFDECRSYLDRSLLEYRLPVAAQLKDAVSMIASK